MKATSFCAATLLGIASIGSFSAAREFGPEWTKIRAPNHAVTEYRRELTVPVLNYGLGGGSGYKVQLESESVSIVEDDDCRWFYFHSPKYGHLKVEKNPDGTPASHEVRFPAMGRPGVQYSDLNGDGILDSMTDVRSSSPKGFILFDDRFVAVHGPAGVGVTEAASPGFKVQYIFQAGKWQIKSRAHDLNGDAWPDALEEFPPGQPLVSIWFEGQWIHVEGSKVSDTMNEATSLKGTKYEFQDGKWRTKKD